MLTFVIAAHCHVYQPVIWTSIRHGQQIANSIVAIVIIALIGNQPKIFEMLTYISYPKWLSGTYPTS